MKNVIKQAHNCDKKKVYLTEEKARRAAVEEQRTFGGFRKRPYRCPCCGGWHLTSRQR